MRECQGGNPIGKALVSIKAILWLTLLIHTYLVPEIFQFTHDLP